VDHAHDSNGRGKKVNFILKNRKRKQDLEEELFISKAPSLPQEKSPSAKSKGKNLLHSAVISGNEKEED